MQVVVEFGSTWCTHCEEMFPHYLRLSRQHPQNKYILAQVDYMGDEAKVRSSALFLLSCWCPYATTSTSRHASGACGFCIAVTFCQHEMLVVGRARELSPVC